MRSDSPLEAMVFDLDGTLVDSRHAIVRAVAQGVAAVLQRHEISDQVPDETAIMDAMGLPPVEYYRRILPSQLAHLAPEVKESATAVEVEALAQGEGKLYPAVEETLQALRKRGVRLAIVSNAQEPYFRACLRYLGLAALVEYAECHEELPAGIAGGKAVLLGRALQELRVPAAKSVMVGDRREDIAAGRELGSKTVGLSYGFAREGELDDADHVFAEFRRLLELTD
jgi:phosphoglycolate phosphatase